ncbi:MAG: translocation/assembly module TamB, partial [Caulobacteraceae bacterium]|nr:translocation/assembly module TamB [Caulobacter sp.]
RVDVNLRAADARLPLQPPLTIARGTITATALLYPGAPQVTARAQLSGVRRGDLLVADARLAADLRGGNGRVTLSASGRSGVPFAVAADVGIAPDLYRVGLQGTVNKIPLRLAQPAVIRKVGTDFVLAPTTLLLQSGRVDLSGRFGRTQALQARLQGLDLSLVQAFAPSLAINGVASGVVDATLPPGGATPVVRANLQVARFTRSGLTTVSEPVDLALLATLNPGGAEAHAIVRRRGAVVGRVQARLAPIPAGGAPWFKRIASAPVSGGVRYDGPSEVLWALTGVSGQELTGPIAIGADVSGRLERPRITGVIRADALRYENATTGTVLDHIAIDGRFLDTRLQLDKLTANAGRGSLSGSGYADLSAANGFPIDLRFTLKNAQLARSDDISATASGSLAVTNSAAMGALVTGDITVDQARYAIARQGAAQVVDLEGVHRKGDRKSVAAEALAADAKAGGKAAASGPPSVWKLNVKVHAPAHIFVTGMGLEAEWSSDLTVTGDAAHPTVVGDIKLVRGTFSFAGRQLTLSNGTIHLNGSSPPDPELDLAASTTVEGVTATINIGGTAQHPQITFSSQPVLPQDEVLSRLLFGSSVTQLSPLQAVQLAAALNSLRGGGGGLNPLGKLRAAAGLDRLNFYGADKTSGRGPSVGAGKYISSNIYVEVTTDARGYTATQIEIGLTKTLRLLSQVGSFGGSNLKLRYSRDY